LVNRKLPPSTGRTDKQTKDDMQLEKIAGRRGHSVRVVTVARGTCGISVGAEQLGYHNDLAGRSREMNFRLIAAPMAQQSLNADRKEENYKLAQHAT
jgi:hypothetical protein